MYVNTTKTCFVGQMGGTIGYMKMQFPIEITQTIGTFILFIRPTGLEVCV